MSENITASEWVATRGEAWRAQSSFMEAMLAGINDPLIRALHLEAPARIADIGCGGGGTALETWRRAPAGSVVHGFDISPTLVELARERRTPGERAVAFELADMQTAQPEQPYDRLVSRFGVMFFEEPQAAFANLFSWLAPGGRFAFAVWGRPSDNPWMTTVREVVAGIVDMPRPDPAGPGPFRYADASTLLALLAGAGFGDLASTDFREALPIGGGLPAREAAEFALAGFSSFGELLAKAGDAALDKAREALIARWAPHERNNAVCLDACVHIITGTRAS